MVKILGGAKTYLGPPTHIFGGAMAPLAPPVPPPLIVIDHNFLSQLPSVKPIKTIKLRPIHIKCGKDVADFYAEQNKLNCEALAQKLYFHVNNFSQIVHGDRPSKHDVYNIHLTRCLRTLRLPGYLRLCCFDRRARET